MKRISSRTATHGIRGTLGVLLAAALALALAGCDRSSAKLPATLEGAWIGDGTFRASVGEAEVQAQLELLSDGSYRFLVLKPAILALTGLERGTWSRNGPTLTLTPAPPPPPAADDSAPKPEGSVFQQLRKGSAAASKPPKTLTIADDLRDLRFDDGKLALTFTPNPDATAKLRADGEVTDR